MTDAFSCDGAEKRRLAEILYYNLAGASILLHVILFSCYMIIKKKRRIDGAQ